MEDNIKLLGDDGMLGMEFKERTIRVYNTEGNGFWCKNKVKENKAYIYS
ncbi:MULTISPECIES: hypothetical protein [Bacillus]|jgi:hypothetical protein|nr:hypothetical protein [Bacillus mycoides]KIV65850.1 hypothetical protein SZ39_5006 [Bacillus mycoides]